MLARFDRRYGVLRGDCIVDLPAVYLDADFFVTDYLARPVIIDVTGRFETDTLIVDPEQLPGRT